MSFWALLGGAAKKAVANKIEEKITSVGKKPGVVGGLIRSASGGQGSMGTPKEEEHLPSTGMPMPKQINFYDKPQRY